MPYLLILVALLFLLAAYPLKNWLEIREFRKLEEKWTKRLNGLPNKVQYCLEHQQDGAVISNVLASESEFTVYSCARCGAELYGEVIQKSNNDEKGFIKHLLLMILDNLNSILSSLNQREFSA